MVEQNVGQLDSHSRNYHVFQLDKINLERARDSKPRPPGSKLGTLIRLSYGRMMESLGDTRSRGGDGRDDPFDRVAGDRAHFGLGAIPEMPVRDRRTRRSAEQAPCRIRRRRARWRAPRASPVASPRAGALAFEVHRKRRNTHERPR